MSKCPKVPILSESERFFDNRYSKKAIGELKIKDCFTILGRTTKNDGFRGNKSCKTGYKTKRTSRLQNHKAQSCRDLRPKTMQNIRKGKMKNLNLGSITTERVDKDGKELFPNFSVTPAENMESSSKYLKLNENLITPLGFREESNEDIWEVRKASRKYNLNKINTHQYVEVEDYLIIV